MFRLLLFILTLPVLPLMLPVSAMAACTDTPEAGVNWRRCYFDGQDLRDVDLAKAQLREATFQRSSLDGAVLAGADAYRAKFISASLKGVDFRGAQLQSADLTKADLSGAIMAGADLRSARFIGANLKGADLTGASIESASFRNADLSGAIWLDGKRVCQEGSVGSCH